MKKYINILLVLLSGLIVLYHRMLEELQAEFIILPMIAFSLIMYFKYRKVHRQSYFHILAIFVLVVYTITNQEYAESLRLNQFFSFVFFVITIAFFVAATVIAFELVQDRNIKKVINKLLYVYAIWILIFHSPVTDFLTIFISDFAGPVPEDIDNAIDGFWFISNISYIIVVLIQSLVIFLTDDELKYRVEKKINYID